MARKRSRKSSTRPAPSSDKSARERIIEAFMALLAEKPFDAIGFAEIAREAGVSLSDLRGSFGSTLAILAAHVKETDRAVLAGIDAEIAEEPPRERLFDVLMRRLEVLEPHKAAVRSLLRSVGRNPGLAFALNGLGVRSQQWMLTAADIGAGGPRGMLRAQGLALLFAQVLRTSIPALPAPWPRSTARWRAGSAGRACSTISAGFPPAPAVCARVGGGARTTPTKRQSPLRANE